MREKDRSRNHKKQQAEQLNEIEANPMMRVHAPPPFQLRTSETGAFEDEEKEDARIQRTATRGADFADADPDEQPA